MDLPLVRRYQVTTVIGERALQWTFAVELDNGARHEMNIVDAAEIPLLLDLLRRDAAIYFDARSRTLSTGWTEPGKQPAPATT